MTRYSSNRKVIHEYVHFKKKINQLWFLIIIFINKIIIFNIYNLAVN